MWGAPPWVAVECLSDFSPEDVQHPHLRSLQPLPKLSTLPTLWLKGAQLLWGPFLTGQGLGILSRVLFRGMILPAQGRLLDPGSESVSCFSTWATSPMMLLSRTFFVLPPPLLTLAAPILGAKSG